MKIEKLLSYSILGCAVVLMTFCILHHANWIIGDDFLFLDKSAVGKYGTYADLKYGRFFPLAL
ncbi:MAG: hypothetical protein LBS23_00070 [Holosporaceae bacterium]|jgi:hypothetical protein|nr:hypothetical protein [Holosporaceae bacterium]